MRLLGIDIGGTATRAALCSPAGGLLGYGRADGANPRSSLGDAATNVALAVRAALGGAGAGERTTVRAAADDAARTSPARGEELGAAAWPAGTDGITAVGVGAAGAGSARREEVAALVDRALADTGVAAPVTLVTDIEIAFRSVAPEPDGHLLLAGTGAVAARFEGWECVQRCDGMGWVLGDEGSGTWLGLQVLRAAAAALDGRGPATRLTAQVQQQLGIQGAAGDPRQALIRAVDELRPAEYARFAPLAFGADPVAAQLITDAAQRLDRSAMAVGAAPGMAIVLAGGLLAEGSLRDALEAHFPHARYAAHPVVGACALAATAAGTALDRDTLGANIAVAESATRRRSATTA